MNFTSYLDYFKSIIDNKDGVLPELYQDPEYLDYTKLNWARLNRWMKTGKLLDSTVEKLKDIKSVQHWIVITEPWCGDASHIIPFIELMSRETEMITVSYELRDSQPFRIENYLTNGSKSIPVLIIQDAQGNDLAIWGPRPKECQTFFMTEKNKGSDFEALKLALQNWYNADKGIQIQQEIINLL